MITLRKWFLKLGYMAARAILRQVPTTSLGLEARVCGRLPAGELNFDDLEKSNSDWHVAVALRLGG